MKHFFDEVRINLTEIFFSKENRIEFCTEQRKCLGSK